MASPPGTYRSSCACVDGRIVFEINFNVATRALVNRGSLFDPVTGDEVARAAPNACIHVVNTSTRRGELELIGAAVDLSTLPGGTSPTTIRIPLGDTHITAAQLGNVGFNVIEDVGQFGLGCAPDAG